MSIFTCVMLYILLFKILGYNCSLPITDLEMPRYKKDTKQRHCRGLQVPMGGSAENIHILQINSLLLEVILINQTSVEDPRSLPHSELLH